MDLFYQSQYILLFLLFIGFSCSQPDPSNQQTTNESKEDWTKAQSFTENNGWNDPHPFELPPAGTSIIEIDGERLEAKITCANHGTHPSGPTGEIFGNKFLMSLSGSGNMEDGSAFYISGQRQVSKTEESGRIQIDREIAPGVFHISIANTENNPLPLLRINESGEFTFSGELKSLHPAIHTEALTGPATLSGRCQSGWPEGQTENRD